MKTTAAAAQHAAECCDLCGIHIPNGEGQYHDPDDRVCQDCSPEPTTNKAHETR